MYSLSREKIKAPFFASQNLMWKVKPSPDPIRFFRPCSNRMQPGHFSNENGTPPWDGFPGGVLGIGRLPCKPVR